VGLAGGFVFYFFLTPPFFFNPSVPAAGGGGPPPPRPQRRSGSDPTALEKLLEHIRTIGFAIEDTLDGPDRRIWVHITETPDNHSRKIVRKLIELGFEFWPGKGYWR
jgi:hypothetical protein